MHRLIAAAVVSAVTAATLPFLVSPAAAADVTTTDGCLQSVPDPGTTAPVDICFTLFRPAGATQGSPVPMVLHSHGWGGSRTTDPASFSYLTDAGFGVLSFDQRGFGESGGQAYIENPDIEGKDVQRIVDLVAAQPWVTKQKPGDPVLGAIGGSYGGGYQFVGAFSELRDTGTTRFDALVPEITWWSLNESLLPQGVPRTEWATALIAAGLPTDALPPIVLRGFAETTATGNVPGYLHDFLDKNGPEWHVRNGRRLDIPVLFGQGETDNLFPLDQGLKNFSRALTDRARAKSIFVGYNGGHTLPSLLPAGGNLDIPLVTQDACSPTLGSPSFADLGLRFLQQNLQGKKSGLTGFGKHHLTTAAGDRCVTVPSVAPTTDVRLGDVVSTVGVGAPVAYPVAQGPLTIAGSPTLDGTITTLGLDNRAFLALSVGTSPVDAKIVQNNMLPIRENGIAINKPRTGVALPSVAVDVPAGQTLFLTVSPVSDMYAGFGSRVVGAMKLKGVVLHLPVTTS
ncbi:X-Pro dipeptidyl-peptidase (S15 family) [Nocardioides alpinus]|uniref:Peptidase S15 n=1 Tax=Nocardioides alpinus TaxID=748909 RepID=A0A1I0ZBU0_9ACTN|nr:alpha/beta fold hydrolase [Nocardioides alpinus]PKH40700.1 peptidase S15 [Nocardioides alpinus]SFB23085.1 X-Pro dipeptidyl-peptidase (S15 family) [Nocardioides alpinus]